MFKKILLENGLRLITVPMGGVSTVTILVMVDTGSNNETKELSGISHFLEHMFFKGTTRRPGAKILAEELDRLGAYSNAFTSYEHTGYFIKVRAERFAEALDLIADIFQHSLLGEAEVEKERGVILQEYRMYRDDPQYLVDQTFRELLYGDQPAGREISGTPETIGRLGVNDLCDYFSRQYTRKNTFVVVAGNLEAAGGDVSAAVAGAFGAIRSGEPQGRPPVVEPQTEPGVKLFTKDTDQTHLILGARAFGALEEGKRFPAVVLAHLLGGSMASRLFEEIREKRGLAYAVSTSFEDNTTYGTVATYAGVEHGNAVKVIPLVFAEYQRIRDEMVPDSELVRAKESLKGRLAISLESSNAFAFFVGGEEIETGKPMTTDEVFARIDAVTPREIQAVAGEVFQAERLNLAVVGPHPEPAVFGRILAEFR